MATPSCRSSWASRNFAPRLVIMVKEPLGGRVKTRLARDVGVVRATQFFRNNVRLTILRLASDPRWQTILAVSPDAAISSRMFAPRLMRIRQGQGDLGSRLTYVTRNAPAGPLVIIGADVPGIFSRDIASAFRALKGADAVLGPSGDGGYWLIAINQSVRQLPVFENVRWSSPFALADTKRNLAHLNLREVVHKDDVDQGPDLQRLSKQIGRLGGS